MSRRKRKFYAVIVLICAALCVALMFSGCPDPNQGEGEDPGENPGENPGPPEVPTVHPTISFAEHYLEATASIDQDSWTVPSETVVTITLTPSSGWEPSTFGVFRTGTNVPVTPVDHHKFSYTYSFTMPAYSVVIRLNFMSILDAISNASDSITPLSSWEDIDFFNALIRKAQQIPSLVQSDAASTGNKVIETAIKKLAGNEDTTATNVKVGNNAIYLGIVEYKIRNEDLYEGEWISPNTNPPSYKDDKEPANIDESTKDAPRRTNLYYVEEDNPSPTLVPKTGWRRSAEGTAVQDPPIFYGIREFTFTYTVGTGATPPEEAGYDPIIKYNIWLYPCAQYTLEYELNAEPLPKDNGVELKQFQMTADSRPNAKGNESDTVGGSGKQELYGRTSEAKKTGDVGILFPDGSLDRQLYVLVSTTNDNIAIRVTTRDGTIVKGINGGLLESIKSGSSSSTTTTADRFYPASRHYIIKVRPVSSPAPIQ